MADATSPRRRWFQFGLGTFFTVGPMLGIVWWQAASRPIAEHVWSSSPIGCFIAVGEKPGDGWIDQGIQDREPTFDEIARRGGVWSMGAVAAWLVASGIIRRSRFSQPRRQATQP
ncbi:MAG: hypothetical protein HYX69_23350 [Planctomycetia bacterium]|nr:hypothetical protein [Planctomycetia bacterium]